MEKWEIIYMLIVWFFMGVGVWISENIHKKAQKKRNDILKGVDKVGTK